MTDLTGSARLAPHHRWTVGGRLWTIFAAFAVLILATTLFAAGWSAMMAPGAMGWYAALPALTGGAVLLLGLCGTALALRRLVFRPLQAAARRLEAPSAPQAGATTPAEEAADVPGEITGLIARLGIARTTQDEALRLRDLLLRESHHRLKNHLTLLSSFLRLQERRLENPGAVEALRAAQGRLMAIAATYDHVHEVGPEAVSLDGMLDRLARALPDREGSGGSVETDLAPVSLQADIAVKLALVVNELATNALRHGPPGGRVRIALRHAGPPADAPDSSPRNAVGLAPHAPPGDRLEICSAMNGVIISITDDGPGAPANLQKGLGMTIADSLVRAVGARLERIGAPNSGPDQGSGWEIRWTPAAAPLSGGTAA